MNRAATVVSLAVAALLAAALAALWLAPGPQARWRQWQAPPPQAPQLDDVQTASLRPNPAAVATYPAVLERPLFNPARRPQPSASAPAAAPAPAAIEQVRLQGLVAGPLLTGVMLQEDGNDRFVRTGEQVGDWTLRAIEGRDAVFERAGQQRRIQLSVLPDPDAAPSGANAPARPSATTPRQRPGTRPAAAPTPAPAARFAPPAPAARPAPATPAPPAPAAAPADIPLGSFGGSARRVPPRSTGVKP